MPVNQRGTCHYIGIFSTRKEKFSMDNGWMTGIKLPLWEWIIIGEIIVRRPGGKELIPSCRSVFREI
ncbi:hypothetical protein NOC27_3205 [Nitrosococcus oceani AFC27]|nr:hypothetical protein NOC27_3205 [Nitrosococcus oceani AFC27]